MIAVQKCSKCGAKFELLEDYIDATGLIEKTECPKCGKDDLPPVNVPVPKLEIDLFCAKGEPCPPIQGVPPGWPRGRVDGSPVSCGA
jgi:DNA-directed RNA polymerase subunit RPC12/RpoP